MYISTVLVLATTRYTFKCMFAHGRIIHPNVVLSATSLLCAEYTLCYCKTEKLYLFRTMEILQKNKKRCIKWYVPYMYAC